MRTLVLAGVAVALLAGCSDSPSDNPEGDQNATVTISDNQFSPTTRNIIMGSVVEWTNTGSRTHTVTADDGSFDSGNLDAGEKWTREFDAEGDFPFHCKIHPSMTGTINVGKA
jgi:plastocyanin